MRDGALLEVPPVLSGAYRNEEGTVGQFFVNFTPRDSTVRVKVPGEKVSYYGSQEKEKGILVYPVDGEVEFLVPGLSVALIEARV